MNKSGIKAPNLPIGFEDFAEIRQGYVNIDKVPFTIADKTRFLPEILTSPDKVTVFTRPIRFMKSSTFSMISRFLSIKDSESNRHLFEGLEISKDKYAEFRADYQGQFPVVYLTFKGVKKSADNWGTAKSYFSEIMSNLYEQYSYILPSLSEMQQIRYHRIIREEGDDKDLQRSLANMATYLSTHYNKKVIILIDEYDTPLHSAYRNTKKEDRNQPGSYFQHMIDFIADFLGDALKGHECVEKGFMTGVSNIAFSSMYSSLNNTRSCSIFTPKFVEVFGFTEEEVEGFISQVEGIEDKDRNKLRDVIKRWYNGYYIGNSTVRMYNPWSVAQFFNDLPTNPEILGQAYWLEIGDTIYLSKHLTPRFNRLHSKLMKLMLGEKIQIEADKRMRLLDLDNLNNDSAFWGMLLHAGYLSASNIKHSDEATFICDVTIPNYEIQSAYSYLIKRHLENYDPGLEHSSAMTNALLSGNIDEFANHLQMLMEQAVSFYDIPKGKNLESINNAIGEQVYHAFILGLLAGMLSHYELSSNREAGYGRYDIILIPREKGKHGLIFEFKATGDLNQLESQAKEALKQIEEKQYAAALKARELPIGIHIGMSFYGKHFYIDHKKVEYSQEKCVEPV